ncbi:Protein RALF-like [Trichinella spiralis]|uniref:Protein RALF-like n=1 Tax=Trichinella spiralis TaxID=6334 RepID=A0ABR3KQW6_TRISP
MVVSFSTLFHSLPKWRPGRRRQQKWTPKLSKDEQQLDWQYPWLEAACQNTVETNRSAWPRQMNHLWPFEQKLYDPLYNASMTGSVTSYRSTIRTNPWVSPKIVKGEPAPLLTAKQAGSSSERSSGYGSNDSSPACSVHSPNWIVPPPQEDVALQCSMYEDKAVDCNELDFAEYYNEEDEDEDDDVEDDDEDINYDDVEDKIAGNNLVGKCGDKFEKNEMGKIVQNHDTFDKVRNCDKRGSTNSNIMQQLNEKLLQNAIQRVRQKRIQKFYPEASPLCRNPVNFTLTTFEIFL